MSRFGRYLSMLWQNKGMPWRINKFNPAHDPPKDPDLANPSAQRANNLPTAAASSSIKTVGADRIDLYHDMERYCEKLRAVAHHNN
ncbi:hypothetical protein [Sneathiella glossodoripedis]|uniref:hypothetical protein n=1 Tax=Sneathiella glossodoripedis TaxID=418853 RepID=UPI0011DE47F3|nr:hypothetical protein [Sneathiella glossodoripedis]